MRWSCWPSPTGAARVERDGCRAEASGSRRSSSRGCRATLMRQRKSCGCWVRLRPRMRALLQGNAIGRRRSEGSHCLLGACLTGKAGMGALGPDSSAVVRDMHAAPARMLSAPHRKLHNSLPLQLCSSCVAAEVQRRAVCLAAELIAATQSLKACPRPSRLRPRQENQPIGTGPTPPISMAVSCGSRRPAAEASKFAKPLTPKTTLIASAGHTEVLYAKAGGRR